MDPQDENSPDGTHVEQSRNGEGSLGGSIKTLGFWGPPGLTTAPELSFWLLVRCSLVVVKHVSPLVIPWDPKRRGLSPEMLAFPCKGPQWTAEYWGGPQAPNCNRRPQSGCLVVRAGMWAVRSSPSTGDGDASLCACPGAAVTVTTDQVA